MKFRHCLILLAVLPPILAHAAPGDERILAAREAFRVGDRVSAVISAEAYAGSGPHELDPWVDYWHLRQQLGKQDSTGIPAFLAQQKNTYLAERLRSDWLKERGKQADWSGFLADYDPLEQPDTELRCYALQARLAERRDAKALDEARPLWSEVLDLPESCKPVMDRLVESGAISGDDVWGRMRRLLENKRYTMARSTASYLPGPQIPASRLLDTIGEKPQAYLAKLPANFANTRQGREMALFALQRLARIEPAQAASRLEKLRGKFSLSERSYAWGQIAWQGARRHLPEALDWYALAGQDKELKLSEEQLAWQVRAALRIHDWPMVLRVVEQMPATAAAQPDWTYWRGRALAAQGRLDEARASYLKIAGQPNFYGNLADEELGRTITVPPRARAASAEELGAVRNNAGVRRALALFRLGMRFEGVREWNWALRGMNDRQLLAAAELAQRSEVFDRAIYAADRTQGQHDFALRYLAPFRDNVLSQARQVGIDSGWVYGLMRQESRFVMNANSSAGAQGLMQLMPKTAAWVAKKIGMADYHPSSVTALDTNIMLGTNYLRMVLNDLDNHPVLASAAYNAGPGRARRWRAEQPLEGAIYAETIPFDETREYVKKVMSNAVYYAALFENRPQSLKARLGVVAPRGGASLNADGIASLP